MQISPEMMRAAGEMMKSMTPGDMQRMASMAGSMGGPLAGDGEPGGAPSSPPRIP